MHGDESAGVELLDVLEPAPVKPNVSSLASLMVLVFAGWQAFDTLFRTPAFNRSLQVEAVTGGARPALTRAMYHHGEYLYQIAHDWRAKNADEVLRGGVEALPSEDTIRRRSLQAREILTESLRFDPANAYAWALLAFSEFTLGNRKAALLALQTSQQLAPYSRELAFRRLLFLGRVASMPQEGYSVTPSISLDIAKHDVQTLRAHQEGKLFALAKAYPVLDEALSLDDEDR